MRARSPGSLTGSSAGMSGDKNNGPRQGQKDLVLSGGFGKSSNSTRAGFLPICLERAPLGAFSGMPVYLRTISRAGDEAKEAFTLYSTENVTFADAHRARLTSHGVKFVYIPIALHE